MYEQNIIIAIVIVVYTTMLAIWFPPCWITALLTKISLNVKKNWTTSFFIAGIFIWILAGYIDNNQTKNRLLSMEARLDYMDSSIISQHSEMNQMEKTFKTVLESEILKLKATLLTNLGVEVENLLMKARLTDENIKKMTVDIEQNIETSNEEMAKIKNQFDTVVEKELSTLKTDLNKMNYKILGKLRDTDKILEDLVESKREIERKVENSQGVFRHLKDFIEEQDDKNNQFKEDVDQLYQMYNRIQEKRENEYRPHQDRGKPENEYWSHQERGKPENEYQSHQDRENERERGVAKKPSTIVRVINKVIYLAVNVVGSYLGGVVFKEVSSVVGSWLGIT